MKITSSLDSVKVFMNDVNVNVDNESVKVYYNGGYIEIHPKNKQIIIKDINVKYYELYKQEGD